ncbi:hypothetical protein KJ980_03750 [Patescibacteria group bacterium]|nr:hypothetical protein [Patescibacteria group bacterium]MBU4017058.1 hypothetical protein [Patescibacteria group bacterium]MBU4098737.1 hypothetical protein [Patescibacteria group bacterium]
MFKNLIASIIILLFVSILQITKAQASEGIVELGNVNGSATRCFAMSTLINRSTNYLLVIQCQNLIYPIVPVGKFYILWSNPISSDKDIKPIRIGDLEFGKGSFNLENSFSSLFITKEQTQSPDQPSNDKVMEGRIKSISFLEKEPTPTMTPTPTLIPTPTMIMSPTIELTQKITQIATPAAQPKSGWTFLTIMRALGIFVVIIIFIITSIFYIISKIRKS